jgi:23S rRNA pseudouridine2605 synthase/16S rRNA pseudouridine516 synthase
MARKRETKWLRAVRSAGPKGSLPVEKPDWVGRALPRAGVLTPEEAEEAIAAGRVSIAGRVVREPLSLLRPTDEVRLDGRRISMESPTLVLAFHKPRGCVVSTRDETGAPTVFELLRRALSPDLARYGWHAVGRLDRDTTGLLLFSNDERLVRHATLPETHLPKRYLAEVQGAPSEERLEPLRQGLTLDDGPARPARVRLRGPTEVELTITEGRNHQVKRMLGAVGLPVRRLHREAIGGIAIDVPEGSYRLLDAAEVAEGLSFRPGPR